MLTSGLVIVQLFAQSSVTRGIRRQQFELAADNLDSVSEL
jgi:hypothetical protein